MANLTLLGGVPNRLFCNLGGDLTKDGESLKTNNPHTVLLVFGRVGGAIWGLLGTILAHLGAMLAHLGAMLGYVGLSWAILALSRDISATKMAITIAKMCQHGRQCGRPRRSGAVAGVAKKYPPPLPGPLPLTLSEDMKHTWTPPKSWRFPEYNV